MATEDIQVDREDVILLILEANEKLFNRKCLYGITRLEKLVFLLERETDFEGIGTFFFFEAHNFGPFSKQVYEAVDFLNSCDLIEIHEKQVTSAYSTSDEAKLISEICESDVSEDEADFVTEKQFFLTANGRKVAEIMRNAIQHKRPRDIENVNLIMRKYSTWPLNQLIRYVYRQYPDMTVNSIHPEARRLNAKY